MIATMSRHGKRLVYGALVISGLALVAALVPARAADDAYRPAGASSPEAGGASPDEDGVYIPPSQRRDTYRPGGSERGSDRRGGEDAYRGDGYRGDDAYAPPPDGYSDRGGYGEPYPPPPDGRPPREHYADDRTFSEGEILQKGHSFFGSISQGLASAVEYTFKRAGRPNGYILGEDAGGALIAGLRYGEGTLYTKDAGSHKVYWQGPSLGYDVGAAGSKTMVLVYNLRDPAEIYHRFGGVEGSAYVIGGVSVQFQKYEDITLAPIRAGIGLRLGANVGYLKYTPYPTWNPF